MKHETEHASFRLPVEMLKQLADTAEREDRSRTKVVERALRDYVAKHNRGEKR